MIKNLKKSVYNKQILVTIKILVGLALLILSVQEIHWGNVVTGIRSANPTWLFLTIMAILLGLFVKFWRWLLFIRNYKIQSRIAWVYSAYFVGQAVNIVLPFRGGELVRLGYFADEPKILPEIASTILLEKYLDLLALTVCGILISLKISLDNLRNLGGVILPLMSILTVFLLAGIFFGPSLWKKVRKRVTLPESVMVWLDHWLEASQWLRNPGKMIPGILLTLLIWAIMWLTNLLMFKSLGIPLGLTAAGLVLILVYIGLVPALMPANIGPFYFFASLGLLPFGIIHDQAFAYAVVLHAVVTLPSLICGMIGLLLRPGRKDIS